MPESELRFGMKRDDGYQYWGLRHGKQTWYSPESFKRKCISSAHRQAKMRAKKKGVPFDVDLDYLVSIFPKDNLCPIFRMPIEFTGNRDNSPSLDRIKPERGYVRGNLMWISDRANTLKSQNTVETLRTLLTFYERLEELSDT